MDLFVFQLLDSSCSMPSSSSGSRAGTFSGSTSRQARPRRGSQVRSQRHSLGMRLRATCFAIGSGSPITSYGHP
jgi:hypothetical protein